jgi:chromate transport protein ChrA
MAPETTVLIINASLLAFAYLWAYPSLPKKTWHAIMIRDAAISLAALVLAALLFSGKKLSFNIVLFNTNWFVFSFITMMLMETPLFFWFTKKYGLRFDDTDEND